MQYPAEMTLEDIMSFEYEINRIIDIDRNEGQYWAENAELQIIVSSNKENSVG